MDLLKTPSTQSLLDSDLESIVSLQSLDIEELDEAEYALPPSEAPTLSELLSTDDDDGETSAVEKVVQEAPACAALQIEVLQAVSQQLTHAQERSSAGTPTTLGAGICGKLSVGTSHGRILSFQDQVLRWVCDANTERGAVSGISYCKDGTRILVGYARSLVCQYESSEGVILRRVLLGGELWGVLQVTWAGITGLALDTGGSVWLIKFTRPMGVRSVRTSCLFSGARGEVVAMAARDARVLALGTLSRVIVVAGGRAAGVKLLGAANTLPVLTWSESDERILISARGRTMQWLTVMITGKTIMLQPIQKVELKSTALWIGWLGEGLAIIDSNEKLSLWGNDVEQPLDLSNIEPVYASAIFKGVWTEGLVSIGMSAAGASALGGACVFEGALSLLGCRGVLRLRPRDLVARARALFSSDRKLQAIDLLRTSQGSEAKSLAKEFVNLSSEKPNLLANKVFAQKMSSLCIKFNLKEELWCHLWESASHQNEFVEALADAIARGEADSMPPSPDVSQAIMERLVEFAPALVETAIAALPLTALDPHRCSILARSRHLWRAVAAVAAALGGTAGAMRELCAFVRAGEAAGDALLLVAADGLAGRAVGGRPLPVDAQPSARHDALQALLTPQDDGPSPLTVLVRHDARAFIRLLEQSAREPPFAGPLGKQNRLRVARGIVTALYCDDDKVEVLEFITGQLCSGALPSDRELTTDAERLARDTEGERSDRALLQLLNMRRGPGDRKDIPDFAAFRPRVYWSMLARGGHHRMAVEEYFNIKDRSKRDVDELFEYLNSIVAVPEARETINDYHLLVKIAEERPRTASALISIHFPYSISHIPVLASDETSLAFTEYLLEMGRLDSLAPAHLKNLCVLKPKEVVPFLKSNRGLVRPEDALEMTRKLGPVDAVPYCLEAVGDPDSALDAYLALGEEYMREACELCARASRSMPAEKAVAMWRRAVAGGAAKAAGALGEAAGEVLAAGGALDGAGCEAALLGARRQNALWAAATRVHARELHARLSRALRTAGAARPCTITRCGWCGEALCVSGSRVCVCGTGCHVSCDSGCVCGRPHEVAVHVASPRTACDEPFHHNLILVAPPRPDLEGIV